MVGVFHLPPGGHPASWRMGGIFPGGFSLLFRPQAAQGSGLQPVFPPHGTPQEAPTETPRLLSTASITKGNVPTRHGHAQASEQGGGGHQDHSVSHLAQGLRCVPTASPPPRRAGPSAPLVPEPQQGGSWCRRCKVGLFYGVGGALEAGHHTSDHETPPKIPPTPWHTHTRTHTSRHR